MTQQVAPYDFLDLLQQFKTDGHLLHVERISTGHINETFISHFANGNGGNSFIHQRINHHVFKDPPKVMANIERVTNHLRQKISASGGDPDRETLTVVQTLNGQSFYIDRLGNYWRTYQQISGARTYDTVEDLRHVYSAARAFGKFQVLVGDLPGERLFETIPDFHNTPQRFSVFQQALNQDVKQRAAGAASEIDFILQRQDELATIVDGMRTGVLPERITHNDTKLNNVMIDDQTGDGVCVIDLDTVMPGSALYDFGDAVRIGASTAAEDERDLSKVRLDLDMFERLTSGYLDATRDFLIPAEVDLLSFSAKLMCLEVGMRFLTDYLQGDHYFRIHHPEHNLERSRTQFKMVREIENQLPAMNAIVDRYR